MKFKPLKDLSRIDISGVDKKIKDCETPVKLCNFTDVYNNWEITRDMIKGFMAATAKKSEIDRFSLKENMIAITKDSETREDIGMATLIKQDLPDTILGYHTALIIPDNSIIDSGYLNAYLQTKTARKYFSNQASGSGQRYTLTVNGIGDVKVPLPDITIQKKISRVFSLISDNLNVIQNKIEILEKTAELIYSYWFLDFNFPDENGKPYKASGGKMVWDEELKQEIPEGWEISNLGNLIISTVKGEWGKEYSSGKENLLVNCVRGTDYSFLDGSSLNNNIPRRYVKNDESFLKPGDLIVEISGGSSTQSTGRVAYINQALLDRFESPLNTSNFCKGLRIKSGFQNWFYQTWSLLYKNNVFFNYESKTTGIKNLMLDSLLTTLKFPIPDTNTLENYNALIDPIYNKIQVELKEIDQLQEIRSFLLPLLMNGQVTFKDIED